MFCNPLYQATIKFSNFKGRFITEASLEAAIPVGSIGDFAIVLLPDPVIYVWDDLTGMWVNTGEAAIITWGEITGTLSDQADLQAALDAKASLGADVNFNSVTIDGTTIFPPIEQSFTSQTSVTVNHNFGRMVQVSVRNTNRERIIPFSVQDAADENSTTITFSSSTSGRILIS